MTAYRKILENNSTDTCVNGNFLASVPLSNKKECRINLYTLVVNHSLIQGKHLCQFGALHGLTWLQMRAHRCQILDAGSGNRVNILP